MLLIFISVERTVQNFSKDNSCLTKSLSIFYVILIVCEVSKQVLVWCSGNTYFI